MNEIQISIIGTKGIEQKDSEYKIYNKDEVLKRVKEFLNEDYGYSVVVARK